MQPKDFGFGEDEKLLRDSARKFLEDALPIDKLRTLVAPDHVEAYESDTQPVYYDEAIWKQIVELGWTTLAVPEEAGGAGMKMVAVASLAEEAGRAALPSPLISTLVSTCVLRETKSDGASAALGRIAAGEAATMAMTNATGSWEADDTDVVAEATGDGVKLSGTACFVQDARKANFFVVAARSDAGIGLYCVDADAPGVEILPDQIDRYRRRPRPSHHQEGSARGSRDSDHLPAGYGIAPRRNALPRRLRGTPEGRAFRARSR